MKEPMETEARLEALRELTQSGGRREEGLPGRDVAQSAAALSSLILLHAAEAIACVAVENKLTWPESYLVVARAMSETAELLRDTAMHPARLKDLLCEPESVAARVHNALEQEKLRGKLMDICARVHAQVHGPDEI